MQITILSERVATTKFTKPDFVREDYWEFICEPFNVERVITQGDNYCVKVYFKRPFIEITVGFNSAPIDIYTTAKNILNEASKKIDGIVSEERDEIVDMWKRGELLGYATKEDIAALRDEMISLRNEFKLLEAEKLNKKRTKNVRE